MPEKSGPGGHRPASVLAAAAAYAHAEAHAQLNVLNANARAHQGLPAAASAGQVEPNSHNYFLDADHTSANESTILSETPHFPLTPPSSSSSSRAVAHRRGASSTSTIHCSATITTLTEEPLFMPSYLADDASESAIDFDMNVDRYSFHSAMTDMDDDELSFPELLADDCSFVDQQYAQAEAIHLVSAGRPTMIELLKSGRTDKRGSQLTLKRPYVAPITPPARNPYRKSTSFLSETGSHSSESSGDHKTDSTSDSTPTTPMLDGDGSLTPTSEYAPMTPDTPKDSFDHDNSSNDKEELRHPTPTAAPTLKSRVKVPARLRLFPRRTSSAAPQAEMDNLKALPLTPIRSPETPRSSVLHSATRPKLVARGASERAPAMELPPSPTAETALPKFPEPPRSSGGRVLRKDATLFNKRQKIRRVESRLGLNGS